MTNFAVGDIHGRSPAFEDVLKKSNFDKESDYLIVLGDIVDGYRNTKQCFEILEMIKNKIITRGNHDQWFLNWIKTGFELPAWIHQGGYATLESYEFDRRNVPTSHINMIENSLIYYIDYKNNIYCHGGFDPHVRIEFQEDEFIMWDRSLCNRAYEKWLKHEVDERFSLLSIPEYNHVFLGHTSTGFYDKRYIPLTFGNITMLDTGGGDRGKLSMMNVDTFEYYQSDKK
jgi:serine/threonine protein phosphatase 1